MIARSASTATKGDEMVLLGGSTRTLTKILPLRALPPKEIMDVLGELYETLLREDRWPEVLGHLAELFEAADAAFVEWSGDFSGVRYFVSGRRVHTQDSERLFLNHYGLIDPAITLARSAPVGAAANCVDVFKPEFVETNEYYQGYLLPQNLRYRIAIKALSHADSAACLFVYRHPEQGAFEVEHMQLLAHLGSHFRRLAQLHYEMRRLRAERREAIDVLDRLPVALATVTREGRVRTVNRLAGKYFADNDGIGLVSGLVEANRPESTKLLRSHIDDACKMNSRVNATSNSLRLPRSNGAPPLVCIIAPGNASVAAAPYAILSIADPAKSPPMSGRHLVELYGLTQAEARLACDLLDGKTVEEIAREHGVAVSTVRTQLSATLKKCGTDRQADLIRLLCRIPAAVQKL